jgi:hypothetical protein
MLAEEIGATHRVIAVWRSRDEAVEGELPVVLVGRLVAWQEGDQQEHIAATAFRGAVYQDAALAKRRDAAGRRSGLVKRNDGIDFSYFHYGGLGNKDAESNYTRASFLGTARPSLRGEALVQVDHIWLPAESRSHAKCEAEGRLRFYEDVELATARRQPTAIRSGDFVATRALSAALEAIFTQPTVPADHDREDLVQSLVQKRVTTERQLLVRAEGSALERFASQPSGALVPVAPARNPRRTRVQRVSKVCMNPIAVK